MGMKKRGRGPKKGLTRTEAIRFMAECYREKGTVETIKFDDKIILPEHRTALVQIANVWDAITNWEKTIIPHAIRRHHLEK